MDNQTRNIPVRYTDYMKLKSPIINLPFSKTDSSVFQFYSVDEINGPIKLASCTTCGVNLNLLKARQFFLPTLLL